MIQQEISSEDWKALEDRGHIREYLAGQRDLNWLGGHLYALWMEAHPRKAVAPSKAADIEYFVALRFAQSKLIAAIAARDRRVVDFREEHLGGSLLPEAEMISWLKEQATKDGPAALMITASAPVDQLTRFDETGRPVIDLLSELPQPVVVETVGRRVLACALPNSVGLHYVAVANGGTLDRLRTLGRKLADRYEWMEHYAVRFVLTGQVPWLPSWSQEASVGRRLRPKVALTLDLTLTPKRVADIYRRLQLQYLGAAPRKLSQKHIHLAEKMADWVPETPWRTRMEEWNRTYRQWRYSQESNFRRDSLKARERVLGMAGDFEGVLHANEVGSFPELVAKIEERLKAMVLNAPDAPPES